MHQPSQEQPLVWDTLHIFYRALRKYPARALLTLLLPLSTIILGVAVPYYAGKVLAGLAQQDPALSTHMWLLGISSAAAVLLNRIGAAAFMVSQARAQADTHAMIFNRLLERSVGFHTNRISGKLVSDAIDYANALGQLSNAILISGLPFVASLVAGLVIVLINSWQLGLFLTGMVAVVIGWAAIESRRRSSLRAKRLVATKNLTAHLSDTIINVQTVKTFSSEAYESQRNATLNKKLETLRIQDWSRAGRSGNNRIAALLAMQLGMVLLVVHLTRDNPQMLATGIFAFTYTLTLSGRLFDINTLTRQIEEGFMQTAPITAMLKEAVEIQDQPGAHDLRVTRGAIGLTGVSFAYADSAQDSAVFRNLHLHVQPGEKIGLVGPSGGGKSTLTRLLLRFDDIQEGAITIDGQNIAQVTQASLRRHIAYVPQEPLLFHRSIRENIGYGKPDATQAAIVAAAKKAHAHEFISTLPDGYDTVVGERGVKLSGGQRQRVAIARAILKDAPILILDEATSALDSESEVLIQKGLWQLMEGRTALVIAHRLSTIQKMDRILVLENGRITEEGTHKQLLRRGGTYARLWGHQSGGFLDDET